MVSDREARALAALVETWVQEERDVFAAFAEHREEAVRRPGLPTLGEASKEFVVWLQNRPVSPLGAKQALKYAYALERAMGGRDPVDPADPPIDPSTTVDHLSVRMIDQFMVYAQQTSFRLFQRPKPVSLSRASAAREASYLVAFWRWAHERWPKRVDPAPSGASGGGRGPASDRFTDPPRTEEIDAWLRRIEARGDVARWCFRAGLIARFAGLRLPSQLLTLRAGQFDFDDPAGTTLRLYARQGKSSAESRGRRVAVSPVLDAWLRTWRIHEAEPDTLLFLARTGRPSKGSAWDYHARPALEACLKAGEIRPEVLQHEDRGNQRRSHLFRAWFQDFLVNQEVQDSVIDHLVGHHPRGARGHYRVGLAAQRNAVALLPAYGPAPQVGRVLHLAVDNG